MKTNILNILKDCPKTLDYLTLDDDGECPLCWDIDGLTEMLPFVVTESDGNDKMQPFVLVVGWALTHLKEIRDELKKGGKV